MDVADDVKMDQKATQAESRTTLSAMIVGPKVYLNSRGRYQYTLTLRAFTDVSFSPKIREKTE